MDQNIVFSPLPLTDLVGQIARAVRSELDAHPQVTQPLTEEILTRVATAELLGITLPTLRDYTRRGIVEGYRIGSRVRYKRSEVLNSLQRIRAAKSNTR